MSQRCVTLVGMMGAGKTKVGRELAKRLGYEFLDTDSLVEKRAGKSITRIFAEDGEDRFRDMEHEAIASLKDSKSKVIAVGGGAFTTRENRRILSHIGMTVYLKASARELYARIKNDTARPLLQGGNPQTRLATLLSERADFYERAGFVVDTEDLTIDEVVEQVIEEMAKLTLDD